jgi:hypothetical protein
MNPSLIGLARCGVTSWCLNFVELFSVNYAATSGATGRISIRYQCISGPDLPHRGEHSGILIRVIHKGHKDSGFWISLPLLVHPYPAPGLYQRCLYRRVSVLKP